MSKNVNKASNDALDMLLLEDLTSEASTQPDCDCHCHMGDAGCPPNCLSVITCEHCVSEEPKQIACECYQTVNGKVHCALHCPNGYDHSKLNPTPSLNTWDMEIRKIISKHNPKTCAKENNHWTTVNAIKELITLAIQKERADHFVDANKLIEDAVQKEREETRTRLTKFWKAAYAGGHKPDYLDGINNAIKLFNKVNCKNGCWTREHSAFINQECPEHKITFKGVPCVDDKGVEEK